MTPVCRHCDTSLPLEPFAHGWFHCPSCTKMQQFTADGQYLRTSTTAEGEMIHDSKGVRMRTMIRAVLVACVLTAPACGATIQSARHIATVSIVTAHSVLSKIQDTEMLIVCGKPTAPASPQCVSEPTHWAISQKFVQAFDYDGKIARLVRATPEGAPTTAEVLDLLGKVQALVSSILADLPSSPKVNALTASLEGAR